MKCISSIFAVLLLPLFVTPTIAADGKDRIVITRDADKLVTHITIEARKGQIAWSDVLAGLARAKGYDDTALAGLMPDSSFPIDRAYSDWAIFGWNRLMPKGIRLRRLVEPGDEPRLTISLDRAALLGSKRRLQKLFRDKTTRTMSFFGCGRPRDFGIRLDKNWHKTPVDKPIVLLVPGFQASHDSMAAPARQLKKLGYLTATCSYPNDQPIDDSARLLAHALKSIAERQPKRPIRIVAYSMGGLVVRRAIEDPELDPGNVKQLIMVAVPNQGSRLASLGFALELWEHGFESNEGNMFRRFYACIEDGLGEADEDLSPESLFLRDLNARPRNPKVAYSILLGTGGFLTHDAVNTLREQLKKDARENRLLQFLRPKLDRWLADLDEVICEKGDGAVALSRGKLAGVDDVVTVDVNHLNINRDPRTAGEQRLLDEIGKRLRQRLR